MPDIFLYNLRVSSHSICYKCPLVERSTLTFKNIYTRHILQFLHEHFFNHPSISSGCGCLAVQLQLWQQNPYILNMFCMLMWNKGCLPCFEELCFTEELYYSRLNYLKYFISFWDCSTHIRLCIVVVINGCWESARSNISHTVSTAAKLSLKNFSSNP